MSTYNTGFYGEMWKMIPKLPAIEPAYEILILTTWVTSEGSGQPAHLRSLARAFAVRTHEVWK